MWYAKVLTLVEWPGIAIQSPWVRHNDLRCAVEDCRRELPTLEERLIEFEVEHEMQARVDVYAPNAVSIENMGNEI